MSVPGRHQGAPLPLDHPYQGQWLLWPRIFLYRPRSGEEGDPGKPRFTAEINSTLDDWSFSFDATQLADALGVSVDTLFRANEAAELILENVEAGSWEGVSAKQYTFRLGEKTTPMVLQAPVVAGRA